MKYQFQVFLLILFSGSLLLSGCGEATDANPDARSEPTSVFGGKGDDPFEAPDTVREPPIITDSYHLLENNEIIFRKELAHTFANLHGKISDEFDCATNKYEKMCVIEPARRKIADKNDPRFDFQFDSSKDRVAGILYRALKEHGEKVDGLENVYKKGRFMCAPYEGKEFGTCRRARYECDSSTNYRCRIMDGGESDTSDDVPPVGSSGRVVGDAPYPPERYSSDHENGPEFDWDEIYLEGELAEDLKATMEREPGIEQSYETYSCDIDDGKTYCGMRVAIEGDDFFQEDTILRVLGWDGFTSAVNNLYATVKKHGEETKHRGKEGYELGRYICTKTYREVNHRCTSCAAFKGYREMYDCSIREKRENQ